MEVNGGKVLIYDGYRYKKNKLTASAIWWRCWRKACGAAIKTNIFNINEDMPAIAILNAPRHNHAEYEAQIERETTRIKMQQVVLNNVSRPIKRAYGDKARTMNQGGGDAEPLPEFHRVRTLLQRTRHARLPPISADVTDVTIEDEWATTWSSERFLLKLDNDWGIAVFATDENLRRLHRCSNVYMDGTFRTCQSPYMQYFTIHRIYEGRVLPFATALLSGKTTGHYRQVLKVVKREGKTHVWSQIEAQYCGVRLWTVTYQGESMPKIYLT